MKLLASEVALAVGGRLVGGDVALEGANFDSRSLRPGQLFVALVAERDGHDFVESARAAGAAACLVSRPVGGTGPVIEVADTARALMDLATWARRTWGRRRPASTVVGITGSVGKTTTKDLAAAACAAGRATTANERSFNNEQGLPVTILGAPDDTDVLILEMGMRGLGHIRTLCEVAQPEVGLITVVGESHTEMMAGGLDGVALAKGELVEALPPHGTAILNADDPRVAAMADRTAATVLTYGAVGDVRFSDVVLDELARPAFRVDTPWGSGQVSLALSGRHMVANSVAALAVAGVCGVGLDAAIEALADASVSAMRMERIVTPSGAIVINDAYNANPTSMRAALDALASTRADRRVAVVGPMAELADPDAAHRAVAIHAAELDIELVAVGTDRYGVSPTDDITSTLGHLTAGTIVLVKASRSAGLERIVTELVRPAAPPE